MMAFKVLIGLLVILPGVCVLWAKKNTKFKNFLEEKLLENKDLFGGQHKYSTLVKWSGWQNVIVGILILSPLPLSAYVGFFIGVCLGVFKHHLFTGKSGECGNVDDRPIEGEVVGNTTSANDSDGQGLTSDTETAIKDEKVSVGVVGNTNTPTGDEQKKLAN